MPVELGRTDEELMKAYQQGETTAFNELYARYSGRVYGYLTSRVFNKAERDDLFQAIFLKLHKSRRVYSSEFLFAPWLFTICRTSLLDFLRSKKSEEVSMVNSNTSSAPTMDEGALLVTDSITQLSEPQRKALEMRYQDGLEFSEIADRMKTSSSNVRQIISRGLRKIREKLS
jgi:RNA polymerase sigma-70 factor (ECF subfamily)